MAEKEKAFGEMTKEERKSRRKEKWQSYVGNIKQMWTAFTMQSKEDKWLLPIVIGIMLGTLLIVLLITGFLLRPTAFTWVMMVILALMLGLMLSMLAFTRRMTTTLYAKAEGQPGVAGWILSQMKGPWRVEQTVAGNAQLDVVHRVIGRPGVILVGEGQHNRVAGLLRQQKRKVSRIVGDTPIYEIFVGNDEGEVKLKHLARTLRRLPKNIERGQVDFIHHRLESLAARSNAMGMPKGPVPGNARLRGVQRSARRRSGK